MLILIVKKHRNHLEPVHLLTLSGLVDIVTVCFNYFIFDLVSLIWSDTGHSFTNLDRLLAFSIWLGFYLDVMAAEVNELIFASFDHVKYHEYITNNKAMATLIVNKAIAVFIVGLTSWIYPSPPTSNFICFIFFTNVAFYLSCLPFFLCFFLSLSVFIYMTVVYLKVTCSQVQVDSQNQGQSVENPIFSRSLPPSSNPAESVNDSEVSIGVANNENQIGEDEIEMLEIDMIEQIQHISDVGFDERIPSPHLAWFDPSLWAPASCVPPSVSLALQELKKYIKIHIQYSFSIISFHLPLNVMIFVIKFWDLKCQDWAAFVENFMFFQLIFMLLYPYYVKVKLDNFLN